MMIRDLGYNVEFWINSNNSSTWSDHIPWNGTVNGASVGGSYNYPAGAGWRRVGVWGVGYNQTVHFNLGNTGTSGFGGPTNFSAFIQRATVPPAPNAPVLSSITSTGMHVNFEGNGDGGSVIYIWQTAWGTDPDGSVVTYVNDFDFDLTGLTPGTTYYFWARGQNAQGYGEWSTRSQATTLRVPDAPSSPVISDLTQVSAVATWTPNFDGGTAITAFQVGYSTTDSSPTTSVTATSPKTLTGLSPGVTYYFRTRAQNAIGWGPWSPATVAKTIAGARVKVGAVWKDAIPYVRAGGTWQVARPWVRSAGEWKQTT
jgi:hypothetical protein